MDHDPFLLGPGGLEVVGGHLLSRAPVDDHRVFDAEPLGGSRYIHSRVAAAIDDDAAAELWWLGARLHVAQQVDRVEDSACGIGRDLDALG